jgi:hypothetical protein
MSDDRRNGGGQDRKRISLNEDYEVRDWAETFVVNPDALKAAVGRVRSIADVERDFKSRAGQG